MKPPSDSPRHADWRQRVEQELRGADFDATLVSRPYTGIEVQPLYSPGTSTAGTSTAEHSPGTWTGPVVAGALGWHSCSLLEAPSIAQVRRQWEDDAAGGSTAAWLRFDLATRLGLTTTDGTTDGIPLRNVEDLEEWFGDGLSIDTPWILDAGANALPAALTFLAFADSRGAQRASLELHCGLDPLTALATDGELPGPLDALKAEMRQLTTFCDAVLPRSTALTLSTVPIHEAGGDPVDELGWLAAALVETLRWMDSEGVEPATVAPRVLLRLTADTDLFGTIAKLRAARTLWQRVLTACGVDEPPAPLLHVVGGDRTLTRRDPWVNMLRATSQGVGAVLGGAGFVTVPSWDRPLGSASTNGRRLARNTQSILGLESALGRVADPGAGSYYLEALTDQFARAGWQRMREIEARGGACAELTSGRLATTLAEQWSARADQLARREIAITGVSEFANLDERVPQPASPAASERTVPAHGCDEEDLELASALDRLSVWCRCAASGASIAELSQALDRAPNEDSPAPRVEPLPRQRDAAAFEALRARAESAPQPPLVHLERLGPLREHKARADFARRFFAAGGIAVAETDAYDPAVTPIACLCGTDDAYATSGADDAARLRAAGASTVLVAGRATALGDPSAVDGELHLGADLPALLTRLLG